MSDDTYFPFAQKKNYENNPIEGFYGGFTGLRTQDDGASWNKNDDGKFDEGLWFNSYIKPNFEVANKRPLEEMLKRLQARQNAENYFY